MGKQFTNAGVCAAALLLAIGAALITGRAVSGGGSEAGIAPLPTCSLPTVVQGIGCPTPCVLGAGLACDLTPSPTTTPSDSSTPTTTSTPDGSPTATPSITPTPSLEATPSPTEVPPTETPTPTETPSPTATPSPTPTPTPAPVLGDVDCDDSIDTIDAALLLQHGAGLLDSLDCPLNGDINGDGATNSIDASFVLQYAAGLIDQLPPERTFVGTVVLVLGREVDCLALETGAETWILLDPADLSVGDRVRVRGFIDPFVAFCGFTPVLRNTSIEHLD